MAYCFPAGSLPQIAPANNLVGVPLVLPRDFQDNSPR